MHDGRNEREDLLRNDPVNAIFHNIGPSSILQEDGKAKEDACEDDGHAITRSKVEHGRCGALVSTRGIRGYATESRRRGFGCFGRKRRGGGRGCNSAVALVGVLSTTRVLSTAVGLASLVTVAVLDALVAPFSALVVWDSLGPCSKIRGDAIVADARVDECIRVAIVILGSLGLHAWLLKADERALGLLVDTPLRSVAYRDRVGVNVVLVLSLGEGGNGEHTEG